jgi:hypothetical protein
MMPAMRIELVDLPAFPVLGARANRGMLKAWRP